MRCVFVVVLAVGCVGLGGCSQPTSRVHGTIRFQGEPLPRGSIIFLASDNQAYPVRIKPDGSYDIRSVPRGPLLVSIQVEPPRIPPRAQPDSRAPDPVAEAQVKNDDAKITRGKPPREELVTSLIPQHYADPNKSGLGFDLQEADREFSPDLE